MVWSHTGNASVHCAAQEAKDLWAKAAAADPLSADITLVLEAAALIKGDVICARSRSPITFECTCSGKRC